MNLKLFIGIILAVVLLILAIAGSVYMNRTVQNINSLHNRIMVVHDSLEYMQYRYDSLANHYEQLDIELTEATSKLMYVQTKLDTLTSHRIRTFTEVQTKLIELKLGLGHLPAHKLHNKDSAEFRFK